MPFKITTAQANSQSGMVFTGSCLVTGPNNVLLGSRRYQLATWVEPHRKHRVTHQWSLLL
jgi:hypothetical protein